MCIQFVPGNGQHNLACSPGRRDAAVMMSVCLCPTACRTPLPPPPQERQEAAAAEEAARAARLERLRALVAPEVEADPHRLLAPTVASAQVREGMEAWSQGGWARRCVWVHDRHGAERW